MQSDFLISVAVETASARPPLDRLLALFMALAFIAFIALGAIALRRGSLGQSALREKTE